MSTHATASTLMFVILTQSILLSNLSLLDSHSLLSHSSALRILESMWNQIIAKQFIHLLQSSTLRLREEEVVAHERNEIEHEKDVKVFEANVR